MAINVSKGKNIQFLYQRDKNKTKHRLTKHFSASTKLILIRFYYNVHVICQWNYLDIDKIYRCAKSDSLAVYKCNGR